ncbi:MAG: hypothetical protein JWO58_2841 [Chitinophagaceae bacterium]|nr:hypothetical protein [Chitinophagaceae bacterium]
MSHKKDGFHKFKTVVTYSTLGLGTATGLFFAARFLIKKIKKQSAEKNSLNEGDPSTYARQLKMAFDNDNWMGWGTNTQLVMQVFTEIPSKSAYQKVQNAYSGLYNKSLNADLESELSSDEYNQVIKILSAKK